MDGVTIAVAFVHSVPLGIGTALAIFAHELPQETGDFAILLSSGFSKKKAFFWNLVSGFAALAGGISAWCAFDTFSAFIPYALAFASSSLIYVAMSDLIPSLRNPQNTKLRHFAALLVGILVTLFFVLRE